MLPACRQAGIQLSYGTVNKILKPEAGKNTAKTTLCQTNKVCILTRYASHKSRLTGKTEL